MSEILLESDIHDHFLNWPRWLSPKEAEGWRDLISRAGFNGAPAYEESDGDTQLYCFVGNVLAKGQTYPVLIFQITPGSSLLFGGFVDTEPTAQGEMPDRSTISIKALETATQLSDIDGLDQFLWACAEMSQTIRQDAEGKPIDDEFMVARPSTETCYAPTF